MKDCRAFVYGGCGGNENNFHAIEECREVCSNVESMQNDAVDPIEEQEEEEAENSDFTQTSNQSTNKNSYCLEPLERGPCRGYLKKYGYDPTTNKCRTFVFGGCSGNKNNFNSIQDCRHKCVLKNGEKHERLIKTTTRPETTTTPVHVCDAEKNPGYSKF